MELRKNWWKALSSITNERRIIAVSAMIALSQGLNSIADLPLSYLYKDDFKLDPAQVASLASLFTLPWIVKPIWGMISDNYPLFGYKRKSYVILFGFLGFLSYMSLAMWSSNITSSIFIVLFISLALAFNNVIGEALLVESAQKFGAQPGKTENDKQNQASQNVSIFFGFKHFGAIVSSYSGGLLLEHITKNEIFKLASLTPLMVALVAVTLPEIRNNSQKPQSYSQATGIEEDPTRLIVGDSSTSLQEEESSFRKVWGFLRQPEIYKPLIFLFLFMITPSAGSAMFYFYTTELKFSPGFMGELKLIGSCAVLLGVFIYNRFLKEVSFKKMLFWSSVVCFFLSLSQLLLITRANIGLGIPDKLFCIGDSIIIQVVGELNFLPVLVLACRLCPKNVEGTMYALFLSVFNCGGMISTQLGALFIWLLGITQTDFSNLWVMVVISSAFILAPLPLLSRIQFDAAVKKTEEIPGDMGGEQQMVHIDDGFGDTSIKAI